MGGGMVREMEVPLYGAVGEASTTSDRIEMVHELQESDVQVTPIKSFGEHIAGIDKSNLKDTVEDRIKHLYSQILQELHEYHQYEVEDRELGFMRRSAIQQSVIGMDAAVRYVTHKDRFETLPPHE